MVVCLEWGYGCSSDLSCLKISVSSGKNLLNLLCGIQPTQYPNKFLHVLELSAGNPRAGSRCFEHTSFCYLDSPVPGKDWWVGPAGSSLLEGPLDPPGEELVLRTEVQAHKFSPRTMSQRPEYRAGHLPVLPPES